MKNTINRFLFLIVFLTSCNTTEQTRLYNVFNVELGKEVTKTCVGEYELCLPSDIKIDSMIVLFLNKIYIQNNCLQSIDKNFLEFQKLKNNSSISKTICMDTNCISMIYTQEKYGLIYLVKMELTKFRTYELVKINNKIEPKLSGYIECIRKDFNQYLDVMTKGIQKEL